jgi:hypothetical protein
MSPLHFPAATVPGPVVLVVLGNTSVRLRFGLAAVGAGGDGDSDSDADGGAGGGGRMAEADGAHDFALEVPPSTIIALTGEARKRVHVWAAAGTHKHTILALLPLSDELAKRVRLAGAA